MHPAAEAAAQPATRRWSWGGRVHFAVEHIALGTFYLSGEYPVDRDDNGWSRTRAVMHGGTDGDGALMVAWANGKRSVLRIGGFSWALDVRALEASELAPPTVAQGHYEVLEATLPLQPPFLDHGLIWITIDSGNRALRGYGEVLHVVGAVRLLPGDQ